MALSYVAINTLVNVCLHLQSCLMCVAFHPEQPAVVAGGTFSGKFLSSSYLSFLTLTPPFLPRSHPHHSLYFLPILKNWYLQDSCFSYHFRSGEVRVWNTGVEGDPLLTSSGFTDLGHKEPVAKVHV